MDHKTTINLLSYLIPVLLILFPGISVNAQTTEISETENEIMEKKLPPIDQNVPIVFDTAYFGLG